MGNNPGKVSQLRRAGAADGAASARLRGVGLALRVRLEVLLALLVLHAVSRLAPVDALLGLLLHLLRQAVHVSHPAVRPQRAVVEARDDPRRPKPYHPLWELDLLPERR